MMAFVGFAMTGWRQPGAHRVPLDALDGSQYLAIDADAQFSNVPPPVKLKIEDFPLLDVSGAFADYSKT